MPRTSKNTDNIISLLKTTSVPMSVEDMFLKLKTTNKSLSLSTVYRGINKLLNLNMVQESMSDGNTSMYELSKHNHKHYLICSECKQIVAIDGCPLSKIENEIADKTGFKIMGHKFEIYGICKNCSAEIAKTIH